MNYCSEQTPLQLVIERWHKKVEKCTRVERCLTMRAADGGESARFTGIFLASSFFCSQAFAYARPLSAANASR
jgi:hypothetical protein